MPRIRFAACSLIAAVSACAAALAQPVPSRIPGSTHIFPAGGKRGTTVDVRVGAECIPPGANFIIRGAGVSAPELLGPRLPPRGEPSPRRLPTETPICYPKEWQSQIAISADAPLGAVYWRISCAQGGTGSRPFVVGDLPEFIETESNSALELAERVQLPVTINGQTSAERDVDYFLLSGGSGPVRCEVLAARLGSPLDALLDVLDTSGRPLQAERSHVGSDLVLTIPSESSSEFVLRVANVSQHGSPAHVYRINVTNALPPSAPLPAANEGDLLERLPNDLPEQAQPLSLPAAVAGSLERGDDIDWYSFSLASEQHLAVEYLAAGSATASFTELLLIDAAGKELGRARGIDSIAGACRIETRLVAGEYRVRLRDLRGTKRAEPASAYRLLVAPAQADFSLSLAEDSVNVMPGGKTQLEVGVERRGGFQGPIDLRLAPDSPPGTLSLEPAQIPASASKFKFSIAAKNDAPPGDYALALVGMAKIAEQNVERIAKARHLGCDALGVSVGSNSLDTLHVTVQHKPVFRLYCAEAYQYAHRGSIYGYQMEVERLDGFDGPITLQLGDRQNRDLDGIEMHEVTIPPGQNEVLLPIYLPETMHINVQSQSQLYCQGYATFVDRQGRPQAVLVVSEKRNMLRTLPPVVKLSAAASELAATPGSTLRLRVELERTTNFRGPLRVELAPNSSRALVACDPIEIEAGASWGELELRIAADAPKGADLWLKLRGSGALTGSATAVSEDVVQLRVQ